MNEIRPKALTVLIYFFSVSCLFLISGYLIKDFSISEKSFLYWDAEHYQSIVQKGYDSVNSAFFPLFPFFWKYLSLHAYGIVFFNAVVFIAGFVLLSVYYHFSIREMLIMLSIPSLIFMFLPFSESLFFLAGTLMVVGFKKQNVVLTSAGLFLCAMNRPSILILILSALIVEYCLKENNRSFIKKSLIYLAATFTGLFFTGLSQFIYTSRWFGLFPAQKAWGNHLSWPAFPFSSWGGDRIVRLDAASFLAGTTALVCCIIWLVRFQKKNKVNISPDLFFSMLYMAGTTLLMFLTREGSFHSLNRYIFSTPFFMIALFYLFKMVKIQYKQLLYIALFTTLLWLLFKSYAHIRYFICFLLVTLYILQYFLINSENKTFRSISFISIILCNISLQLYFYILFLSGEWIG